MSDVKPIPDRFNTLSAYLIVPNSVEAIEFYTKAFGAELVTRMPGPDGSSEPEAETTADVESAPEEAILDTDQDETAETPVGMEAEAPEEETPEEAQDQQPEPPEDAPDAPGPEDTTTDTEDS